MPRRREVPKRKILPDPKFRDRMVTKFINVVMQNGKKLDRRADRLRRVRHHRERATRKTPSRSSSKALDAVKPRVEVKSRRVGGATYQVPVEVRADRRMALAMRWLIVTSTPAPAARRP